MQLTTEAPEHFPRLHNSDKEYLVELKKRIALLDDLLALNEQTCLPEGQVVTLVEFLAEMPEVQRETVLDYMGQDDTDNRFSRFVNLANMEPGQKDKILKAMGLRTAGKKSFLSNFIGPIGEGKDLVKETVADMASIRKTAQDDILDPLTRLFGWKK